MTQVLRFGIIGCGLMGREFASAAARWCHLTDIGVKPVITAACDTNEQALTWFRDNTALTLATTDYQELLSSDEVDAIYCAVPHHLHADMYGDIIRAGKHLLGEKPFGIDQAANTHINQVIADHPDVVVRCSSEFPFYPGAMRIVKALEDDAFGEIINVEAGFLHSSDLNPNKAINWKRMIAYNGEYGCMGDLGMHVVHIPARMGWRPQQVAAQLSNIVRERPDGKGNMVPCETWDNATLLTRVEAGGTSFPMTLHTKRIAPGEMNTWFLTVHGTRTSMHYSTKYPRTLQRLDYTPGGEQAWQHIDVGYASAYPTITGGIFEFGFPDAMLQMWAAFCDEVAHGRMGMKQAFYCVTPDEAALSHEVFTAALAG
ncbi:MAG: Gfo/Idh/MocA family oxidoreductase [Deinococcota bacterium]